MKSAVVSLPPSVEVLLAQCKVGEFSEVQVLVSLLHWFSQLSLQDQACLVRQYLLHAGPAATAPADLIPERDRPEQSRFPQVP
jgi:hypothetical protein